MGFRDRNIIESVPLRFVEAWVETANADNAVALVTRAAPTGGLAHRITSISGSFSGSVAGALLTLKQGAVEIGRWYVYDAFALPFVSPIDIDAETAVSLELAASGSLGVIGAVTMTGYTA
jgi:hypothetical protein